MQIRVAQKASNYILSRKGRLQNIKCSEVPFISMRRDKVLMNRCGTINDSYLDGRRG